VICRSPIKGGAVAVSAFAGAGELKIVWCTCWTGMALDFKILILSKKPE